MFPNGWPGKGLLILRLVDSALLLYDGFPGLLAPPHSAFAVLLKASVLTGLFLLIGLGTPIAGILSAAGEIGILIAGTDQIRSTACMATIGIALAMLGPGVWSVDSVIYGRRRLDVPER